MKKVKVLVAYGFNKTPLAIFSLQGERMTYDSSGKLVYQKVR